MADRKSNGELIQYQTEDGETVIRLQARDGNVWLSQADMAELFQATKQNISLHIRNILEDGEQDEEAVIKDYLTTASDGKRYSVMHYSLPMILAVGFRVRSPRGAQFRRWAADALSEYLVKGFVMDDERLKDPEADYFEELLARIRDIRSSEKVFYRKVLDIYALSVDYDPKAETSQTFFQTVQNKMHWAAHGHTAAEVIHARADAQKDHMGLTSWAGETRGNLPRKDDARVAKNYLEEDEIKALNRIVTAYLEFAELQAENRKPMYMKDWIAKLDQFLSLSDREILTNAGRISAKLAKKKADAEYDKWHSRAIEAPSAVERHFLEATQAVKQIGAQRKKGGSDGK
ncbi:hydroxyacid dehydrogenase [Erythrobacter sp. HI0019]|uniref:virulence RhuM family protein n=1 Tax=unclassified Erythrobacter TaxID=2633097 RepID=UPI0007BA386E|nr:MULTISPECIES: virulence RhuM family protein [unclassified Erythrobacter]KZX93930.1 hydroxyacid dehydrogenase [Erythrobacter sp. HI0019]KZY09125.1 hydroxyacid dehydrogenase [Erythrobacter sp. HI0028]